MANLPYPPEFWRKIIDLAHAGRRVCELSREFQILRQSIMNWVKQDGLDSGRRIDGFASAERTKLLRHVRELESERDILKETASWFTRETEVCAQFILRLNTRVVG